MPVKKHPLRSKTLWTNAIIGLLCFFPTTRDLILQYPTAAMVAVSGLNAAMRFFSHGKLSLED